MVVGAAEHLASRHEHHRFPVNGVVGGQAALRQGLEHQLGVGEVGAFAPTVTLPAVPTARGFVAFTVVPLQLLQEILGVLDEPGVTRDRHYALCDYLGRQFTVVDTGGLDPTVGRGILAQMRVQTLLAMEEADLLLFLMDARDGVTPMDEEILRLLRRTEKPVVYAVNKVDVPNDQAAKTEFYRLGIQEVHSISAEHGHGVAELLEEVLKVLPSTEWEDSIPKEFTRISVMGRPNVGKSTLVNTLMGEERFLTSDVPGTTRDAIDTLVKHKDTTYVLIDTAGIRRKGRVDRGVEQWSVDRSLKALNRCDLVLLLLDGEEGVVDQDTKLAGQILQSSRGLIILVNKWDLREADRGAEEKFKLELSRRFAFFSHVPILFLSALTGKKIKNLFPLVNRSMMSYTQRVSTGDLNRTLQTLMEKKSPPVYRGRPVKLYYLTQTSTRPPVFVVFCNNPLGVTPAYLKYLENTIRKTYEFFGIPLKILLKKRK